MKHLRWMVLSSRVVTWTLAIVAALIVAAFVSGILVIRSQRFSEYVRHNIVQIVDQTTGGHLEIGSFSFDWETLTVELGGVVLHGKETEGAPLVSAESVTIGLRIISLAERKVDLTRVHIERPRVRVLFYADGSTNIPYPNRPTTWAEDVVDLSVRRYEVDDGVVEYDESRVPLNLRGERLSIRMTYEPQNKLYRSEVSTDQLRVTPPGFPAFPATLSTTILLDRSRMNITRLRFATKESRVDASGIVEDMRAPHGTFTVHAAVALRDAVNLFAVPVEPVGSATFDGRLSLIFAPVFDFGLAGKLASKGAGFSRGAVKIENTDVTGDLNVTLDRLSLHSFEAHALGAHWTGDVDLARWQDLRVNANVDGMGLRDTVALPSPPAGRSIPWSGSLAGNVNATAKLVAAGTAGLAARANLNVSPAAGGIPIQGQLDAAYDQTAGTLTLGPSWAATSASRLDVSGALDKNIQIKLHSTNLDDLLPAMTMLGTASNTPPALPLKLDIGTAAGTSAGTADVDGSITGPLDNPVFAGHVDFARASLEGHAFDRFTADVQAAKNQVQATRFSLARGNTSVGGSATVTERNNTFEDAGIAAQLDLRNLAIGELLREAGVSASGPGTAIGEINGTASGTVRVTGSVRQPAADGTVDVLKPAAFGEQADRLRATVHYAPDRVEVSAGEVTLAPNSIKFSGAYRRDPAGWNNGQLDFDLSTKNLPTSRIHRMESALPMVEAVLTAKLHGSGRIANQAFDVTALDGTVSAGRITVAKQSVGELSATVQTRNMDLSVVLGGKARESAITGTGSWRLQGDDAGGATLNFSRISAASLHSLAMLGGTPEQQQSKLPFDGFLEGEATVSVPLRKPGEYRAEVTLNTVQFNPQPSQALGSGVQPQDLVLRNSRPVSMTLTPDGLRVNTANFVARDTTVEVSGSVPFRANGADLTLRGNINLTILQLLNPDLLARGNASVDATVRGNWQNPAVNGRMQLSDASVYLSDLPNGVDNVKGVILFDRNRATIESLTAETGGGKVSFGGMIEFGSTLLYRLRANAQQVRLRWPEDVSTLFNAQMELNGTPGSSTLSGSLTLLRTVLNPRTDLGRLMAAAAKPSPAPANPNEYLRGMQFDVRVESDPGFKLDTALTHEVQTQVDLRVRGSPLRPVVLGSISVNEGEIQIFGNRYTINRGDVRFQNPVKIDPILDMSLETRARGIEVNVNISGTMQKLRVNYSSDPPLQSSEIVALLAVGRAPSQTAGVTNPSAGDSSSGFVEAGGGLLGEAVSQQLSGTLQRFFGASRVKIDPTLTGIDNQPQARLTMEQQVSRDVTLTYITNLNRTQEQTVRVQWDFDRNWSAVAVRDANGLFGIDVQYRKRFK